MRRLIPTMAALALLGACGGKPTAQQQQAADSAALAAARADTVQMAAAQFDPTAFDTITWQTPQEELERGSLVYRISCSKCHGEAGRGNGGFVHHGDTLRPPSFLTADWKFAADTVGLRKAIYSGSVFEMPYWGLVGLKYRDLDAVTTYILDYLRANYAEGATQPQP